MRDVLLQNRRQPDARFHELFPHDAPAALGFGHVAFKGMKGYNGVAVLSRVPMLRDDGAPDWCMKGDCRHLGVTLDLPSGPLELHDFYVPAGGDIPDREQNPKYGHKLDFVDEATGWFAARRGLARALSDHDGAPAREVDGASRAPRAPRGACDDDGDHSARPTASPSRIAACARRGACAPPRIAAPTAWRHVPASPRTRNTPARAPARHRRQSGPLR